MVRKYLKGMNIFLRSERFEFHIRETHKSWTGETSPPKHLALKTNRSYIQEDYTAMGKGKSALKRLCADSLDPETSAKLPHGKRYRK